MVYKTSSPEETQAFAKSLLPSLLNKKIIQLSGDLGSGKTTFVKGIAKALGIEDPITSPTYTYVNQYNLSTPNSELQTLHHFDLYRLPEHLENPSQTAAEIGLEDAISDPNGLVVIEWPERLPLEVDSLQLNLETKDDYHVITIAK